MNTSPDSVAPSVDGSGVLAIAGRQVQIAPSAAGRTASAGSVATSIDTPLLVRTLHDYELGPEVTGRTTCDVHRHGGVHVHVRLTAAADIVLEQVELPRIIVAGDARVEPADATTFAWVVEGGDALALAVKKFPWRAAWNDVGAHAHRVLADAELVVVDDGLALVAGRVELAAGETIEAALTLRAAAADEGARRQAWSEAAYEHADELRYVPEGEFRQQQVWESDDVWLGPPIFDGCPQRPYDQLIPRPLGLNVLARKRFTWSNEDFSLWRLTGKQHYLESGVKKAFALLGTQNEHDGWYEGIEFYNLPPKHHHMYDTYIGGVFLLDAYDTTGHEGFLAAAMRARDFWCVNPPPANGHVDVAPDAWWYRWGGYINEFGYTDERLVLNTHSGATMFLALLAERTGDELARKGAENGIAAVRWGLDHGVQRGDGQLLYCLSQVDPTLERPGDPPYIKLDLVPQIEDVYTVASSYRLMMANRSIGDEVVTAAIRRALDYWWLGYRAGRVYTYRAYAALGYAVAAGDIDLRYALALPEILRDPQHFTSHQRGLSGVVAPHGLPLVAARVEGPAAALVEPVFLRRRRGEYLVALVNVEHPLSRLTARIELPAAARAGSVARIDPASSDHAEQDIAFEVRDGAIRVEVDDLPEFAVTVLAVRFEEPGGSAP